MTPAGPIADVHARIAVIQARFPLPVPAPTPSPGPGRSGQASQASARPFASALADAQAAVARPAEAWFAPQLASAPESGQRVVDLAAAHLGTPYVWGGADPSGFDCSGLVQHVYSQVGVDLPRVSRDQARAGEAVASLADARPGDLVAFGEPVDHIGIYAGQGRMVVAPHRGAHVRFQEINRTPTAIRRVL